MHLPAVLEKLKKLRGVKEIADDSLEEWASELRYGTLSGEDYANLRLKVFLKRFEDEADGLETGLFCYKIAIYGLGVLGGILSLTGLEVRSFHRDWFHWSVSSLYCSESPTPPSRAHHLLFCVRTFILLSKNEIPMF